MTGLFGRSARYLALAVWVGVAMTAEAHQAPASGPAQLLEQAAALEKEGKYREGIPLVERAVALYDADRSIPPLTVADALTTLGALRFESGDYAGAGTAFERALGIREKTLGPNDAAVAAALNDLANARHGLGQLPESETLFRRALGIQEAALGKDDLEVAATLISLGGVLADRGDVAAAETAFNRARDIFLVRGQGESMEMAVLLNNIGLMYQRSGALDKAQTPLEQSLAIREKLLKPGHPQLARALASLAVLYQERGDLDRAESALNRVLAIYERTLGPQHPSVAAVVNNLAMIHLVRNDLAGAEPLYQRALAIREQLGPGHSDVARSLEAMAVFYQVAGRPAEALRAMARSADIVEQNLRLILASGSEQERLSYMATLQENTDIALSLRAAALSDNPEAAAMAITIVLNRKGRVLDAMVTMRERLVRLVAPEDRALVDRYEAASAELGTLVLHATSAANAERDAKIRTLNVEIDSLESQLSRRGGQVQADIAAIDRAQVQALVAEDTLLIEVVKYRPFDPRVAGRVNRFGRPKYAVCLLRRTGDPRWLELGDAEAIERRVAAFRDALRSPSRPDFRPTARELARVILDPLDPSLAGVRRLLIAPDGELSVIPFAALVDEQGRYLLERVEIGYLASGRDLLRLADRRPANEPALIVANPAFHVEGRAATGAAAPAFSPLPGTAVEARALARLLPDAHVATGAAATETLLKQVKGPRLLHIATHGFFFNRAQMATPVGLADSRGLAVPLAAAAEDSTGRFALLRSGLALAGASDRADATGNDGLLTALEAASLDLHGTQMVVLSACDTGLGEVRSGDGVHGLRRALAMAGAESQVMSLWPVSDRAASDLMVAFYRRLVAGDGRGAALRTVQLEFLHSRHDAHPFYWAAFLVAGDWSPLRLAR